MTASDRQLHWQTVYLTKGEQQVSWSQADPQPSLRLIESVAPGRDASIIDIGGGASRLVDALLMRGFHDLTVLDLSEAALASARKRIGATGDAVLWVADDATVWQLPRASTSGTIVRRFIFWSRRTIARPISTGCIAASRQAATP